MTLFNGAGVLVAISVLPMLVALFLRESWLARFLRSLAIILAVALPIIFMVLVGLSYLQHPADVFFDFKVNYDAAMALYGQNGDPYSIHAAYSFPFPTFFLYWVGSLFGRLDHTAAWIIWWVVNGVIWLVCGGLLWRTLPSMGSPRRRDVLIYMIAAVPAVVTLWQGQTALLALAGLVALHMGTLPESTRRDWIIGGVGLGWAMLIKPQIALVGLGVLLWTVLLQRERRLVMARRGEWIIGAAVVTVLLLIGATLIVPGGVSLDTYQRFISEALPQIASPGDNLVIGSPSYVAARLAISAGVSAGAANLIGTLVTGLVIVIAALWTLPRRHHALVEIAAGWGVWAMVALRVAWTWYAAWCLPFFLLATDEAIRDRQPRRLALFVLLLAMLNMQFDSLIISFAAILLLIGLLWTSFKRTAA